MRLLDDLELQMRRGQQPLQNIIYLCECLCVSHSFQPKVLRRCVKYIHIYTYNLCTVLNDP
jgi:hypothetical protein